MQEQERFDPVSPFWREPDIVDRFASREPDRRLAELLGKYAQPSNVRVLDLGCAGGRNTALLASCGFDFQALDGSRPMVVRTRDRVAAILGTTAARERVHTGTMDDLGAFREAQFHLIVALGIYHQALSLEQWRHCISESARVLLDGGLILVSSFTPASQPEGEPLVPADGSRNMYHGFSSGPLCLLSPDDHDEEMVFHGLEPSEATQTVRVETELGFRVTMNALYRKSDAGRQHDSR